MTAAPQALLSSTISQSLLKLMSIESVMPSNHLILCHPLLQPSIFPNIRVFSNESALCIRWPKYWSFSFSISPSIEHPGLISFRMDWSPCSPRDSQESSPAPQLKASVLRCSAFFLVQLSHPYMTIGKTIALTIWTWLVYTLGARRPQPWYPDQEKVLPQVREWSGDCVSLTPSVWVRIMCRGRPYTQNLKKGKNTCELHSC